MQLPIMPPAASLNEQKDRETGTDTSLSSRFPAYSTVPTYRSRSIESIPENSVRFTGIEAEKWQTDSTSITRDDGKPQRAKQKLKRVGRPRKGWSWGSNRAIYTTAGKGFRLYEWALSGFVRTADR
jgi:hypothetical protein